MFQMKNGRGKVLQKSRAFQKKVDSDIIPLLQQRSRKAYYDECSESMMNRMKSTKVITWTISTIDNSRYIDGMEQQGSDNDVSFPPSFLHPTLASQKLTHLRSVPKSSPSKISLSFTAKPIRTAGQKRTTANNYRRKKAKHITTKTMPTASRALPVQHSRRHLNYQYLNNNDDRFTLTCNEQK